jgi:hypothetical protein
VSNYRPMMELASGIVAAIDEADYDKRIEAAAQALDTALNVYQRRSARSASLSLMGEQPKGRVWKEISEAGYSGFFLEAADNGEKLLGKVYTGIISVLQHDPRFASGPFHLLHADVGKDLCEFRSHRGELLSDGSVQIVVDSVTGACYADIDKRSPYTDIYSAFAHLFGEVIFKKRKRA